MWRACVCVVKAVLEHYSLDLGLDPAAASALDQPPAPPSRPTRGPTTRHHSSKSPRNLMRPHGSRSATAATPAVNFSVVVDLASRLMQQISDSAQWLPPGIRFLVRTLAESVSPGGIINDDDDDDDAGSRKDNDVNAAAPHRRS